MSASSAPGAGPPSEAGLVAVADGVFAWIGANGDLNAGAIDAGEGVIVIDTQQRLGLARALREAVAQRIGKPLRAVVNTHFHLDHVAGNSVFAGTPILAHEVTRAKLAALTGGGTETQVSDLPTKAVLFYGENFDTLVPPGDPARGWFERRFAAPEYAVLTVRPPTETFADRFAFHLPDDRVALAYFGPAHADGDIVVHVARRRVVFLGDLFFFGRFPWLGDCDLDGWIATLDQVLALDVATVIPGHGMPTTLKEVAAFRDLLAALRGAVAGAIAAGVSEEAAVREVTLPAYAAMPRYAEWLPFDVRSAYRYLRGSNPSS